MRKNRIIWFWLLALACIVTSCTQEKSTIVTRTYHNMTARYNGYFNARMAMQDGLQKQEESYQEEYSRLLPIFLYTNQDLSRPIYPEMDRVIEKTSLVVDRHSIDLNGKEHTNWVDDSWLLMGKAQFIKGELTQAKQIFDFTKRKYLDTPGVKALSYMWLGRIAQAEEQYDRAGDYYRKAEQSEDFPEEHLSEFYAVKTDYNIAMLRYEKAIEELERAIQYTDDRQTKTRRMFILAQLHRILGNGVESSALFAEIIKRNPPYEMTFQAKINRALAFDVTSGNPDEIREVLFEMLKDEKNDEYQDEIYYALADLEFKEDDEPEGIRYLNLATRNSVRNGNAKGLAFYKLADIYFNKDDYELAQAYYDSTVTFIDQQHPDYELILGRANSLTQLMRDINIVELQDSLQEFSKLSEAEQMSIINGIIEDLMRAEREEKQQERLNRIESQQAKFNQNNLINRNITRGEWYFYNPAAVGFGASEFIKIWSKRKNEDHWRRSNKTSLAPLLVNDEELGENPADTIEGADDPKNPNYYLKDVPNNEDKMMRSHAMIVEALYDLALVYKDQMNDDAMAVETFEELISRYDSCKYTVNSYYQMYLIHSKNNNTAKAEYYKNLILTEHGDSEYAEAIRNPNYLRKTLNAGKDAREFYDKAYAYFSEGYFRAAYDLVQEGLKRYEKSDMQPQFEFLNALCLGYVASEEVMLNALKEVKTNHYDKPVGKEAEEILAFFANGRKIESKVEELIEEEEETAYKSGPNYEYNVGASHNFVMVLPDTCDPDLAKAAASNFNRRFFSTKGYKSSVVPLKEGQLLVVTNVGIAPKAMDYFKTFAGETEIVGKYVSQGYPMFVVSYDNYAKLYKSQNIPSYQQFFEENYNPAN